MKKFLSLFAAILFAGSMMAGSYTISLKDGGASSDKTNGLTSTTVSDYVASGEEYVSAIAPDGKVYYAKADAGIKFGNSSNGGHLTLTLAQAIKPTSIVVSAAQFGASEGAGEFQGQEFDMTGGGGKYVFNDYTVNYDGNTEVTTIIVGTKKRGYVKSITVNYSDEGGGEQEGTVKTVYCKVTQGWWTADGAATGIYAYADGNVENAAFPGVRMEAVEGEEGLWKADIDTAVYHNIIFTRFNPNDCDTEGCLNWGAKTDNLQIPADKDLYTITSETGVWGDPGVEGEWSVYGEEPAAPVFGISGAWDNFTANTPFEIAQDGLTGTFAIDLEAGEYEFKIRKDDAWLTKANEGQAYGLHRDWVGVAGVTSTANENLKLTADVNGVYTFTWTYANDSIGIDFPAVHNLNEIWKVTEETAVDAESEYINNYALEVQSTYAGKLRPNTRAFEGYKFTHAIQVRTDGYPSATDITGKEKTENTSLVITTKEDVEVTFFYNRQTTDNTTGAAALNDSKDMKVFDQAAITTPLNGEFKVVWMQDEKKYVNAIKTVTLAKGHVYTVAASGTTIQLHGIRYISDAEAPVVVPAKFYVTGDSALVVDAGLEAAKAWAPDAFKAEADTFVLKLKGGQDYILKVTVNGTWEGENNVKGYNELTEKTEGLLDVSDDHNIGFKLNEAGEVKVVYIAAEGENPEIFKLIGDFYVAPVPVPAKFYVTGDSALVVDAGLEAAKAWAPDAIKSENDTIILDLNAEQDYKLKVTVDGTWEGDNNVKGFTALTETAEGLSTDDDNNIVFSLAEAGEVKVVYIAGDEPVFKLIGNFLVPDPTVSVFGTMTNPAWEVEVPFTLAEDKKSASITANIGEGSYEFKVVVNGEYRSNGYTYHRDFPACAGITGNSKDNMLFTADVDGNYTISWFFENDSLDIIYPEAPVVIPAKFYVTGDSALVVDAADLEAAKAWAPNAIKSENDTIVLNLNIKQEYKLKITLNGEWETGRGYSSLSEVPAGVRKDNDDNIIFTLVEPELKVIYIAGEEPVYKLEGNFYVKPKVLEDGYYLIGLGAGWTDEALTADRKFEANPDNESEFQLSIALAADQTFKVVSVVDDFITGWYPDGNGNDYVVDAEHAGENKTVYFRPDGQGGEGWHHGVIFVAPNGGTGIENNAAEFKAVKVLKNGMIQIIKGEHIYNLMGQKVQ